MASPPASESIRNSFRPAGVGMPHTCVTQWLCSRLSSGVTISSSVIEWWSVRPRGCGFDLQPGLTTGYKRDTYGVRSPSDSWIPHSCSLLLRSLGQMQRTRFTSFRVQLSLGLATGSYRPRVNLPSLRHVLGMHTLVLDKINQALSIKTVLSSDAVVCSGRCRHPAACKPHEAPVGAIRTIGLPTRKPVTAIINQKAFFHKGPQGKGQISMYRSLPITVLIAVNLAFNCLHCACLGWFFQLTQPRWLLNS